MADEAQNLEEKMQKAVEHFQSELAKISTGRAHPSMLESVKVEAYGQLTPLNQVATVVAVDATLLQISPFDPNNLSKISTAIRNNQSLGLNPSDDGKVIRIPVPPLTEERRREMTKVIGEKAEECRISLRNIRHEELKNAKQAEKSGEATQDDLKSTEKNLNERIDNFQRQIEQLSKAKEAEVMKV